MIKKTLDRAKTISQLKVQITKLEQEKAQLRFFLHELVEAFYRTVNQTTQSTAETSSPWTLNPQLFKIFSQLKNCSHSKPIFGQPDECSLNYMKSFFTPVKKGEHE